MDNKEGSKKKSTFLFILLGTVVLLFIPIGIYMWWFRKFVVSDDAGLWGSFGDFIAPTVGFLNLLALLYLTYLVSDEDGKRSERERTTQLKITKTQMRYQAVLKVSDVFDSLIPLTKNFTGEDGSSMSVVIVEIERGFVQFYKNNFFLFVEILTKDECKKNTKKISKSLEEIKKALDRVPILYNEMEHATNDYDKKFEESANLFGEGGLERAGSIFVDRMNEIKYLAENQEKANKKIEENLNNIGELSKTYHEQTLIFIKTLNEFIIIDLET